MHLFKQYFSDFTKIGSGHCLDATGNSFNWFQNRFEGCPYDLDECKQFCREMGSACVGISFEENRKRCLIDVRNGISREYAEALVPKFCSHDRGYFNNIGSGEVVQSHGPSEIYKHTCWAHQSVGSFII